VSSASSAWPLIVGPPRLVFWSGAPADTGRRRAARPRPAPPPSSPAASPLSSTAALRLGLGSGRVVADRLPAPRLGPGSAPGEAPPRGGPLALGGSAGPAAVAVFDRRDGRDRRIPCSGPPATYAAGRAMAAGAQRRLHEGALGRPATLKWSRPFGRPPTPPPGRRWCWSGSGGSGRPKRRRSPAAPPRTPRTGGPGSSLSRLQGRAAAVPQGVGSPPTRPRQGS